MRKCCVSNDNIYITTETRIRRREKDAIKISHGPHEPGGLRVRSLRPRLNANYYISLDDVFFGTAEKS